MGYNTWKPEGAGKTSRTHCQAQTARCLDSAKSSSMPEQETRNTDLWPARLEADMIKCPFCLRHIAKASTRTHMMSLECQILHHQQTVEREQILAAEREQDLSECDTQTSQSISQLPTKNRFKQWADDGNTTQRSDQKAVSFCVPVLAKELSNSKLAKNLATPPPALRPSRTPADCDQKGAATWSASLSKMFGASSSKGEAAAACRSNVGAAENLVYETTGWRLGSVFRK